jgi:hypothetical protein
LLFLSLRTFEEACGLIAGTAARSGGVKRVVPG